MLLDIMLGMPILFTSLLGFRDGIVRKLIAVLAMIIGLIIGHLYMRDVGKLLISYFDTDATEAPMKGFLYIFLAVVALSGLLYRLIAGGYKIGGIADRSIGAAIGLFQGMLFVSALLMIYSLEGIPSRSTSRDSRLYTPVVNIAPQIVDFLVNIGPETNETLKDIGTPRIGSDSSRRSPDQREKDLLDKARKSSRTP